MSDPDDLDAWRKQRVLARRWALLDNPGPHLPCVANPGPFDDELDGARGATVVAKRACRRCPVGDLCLTRIMRQERGLDQPRRHGVVAGLTGTERARAARKQGCAVCGVALSETGSSQFCEAHRALGVKLVNRSA